MKFLNNYILKIGIFAFFILISSCNNKKDEIPEHIIPLEKMAEILTDIHIAEAYSSFRNLQGESMKQSMTAYYKFIFDKHKISQFQFEESFDFYSNSPASFLKVYDGILSNFSKKEAELLTN